MKILHNSGKRYRNTVFFLLAVFCLACACTSPAVGTMKADSELLTSLGKTSVPFVKNTGQISNSEISYSARTFGGTVYVNRDGKLVYALLKFGERDRSASGRDVQPREIIGSCSFSESIRGAAERGAVEGYDPVQCTVNSYVGNDPSRWRTGLPVFNRVSLGSVSEGITASLRAYGNNVEKIFVVAPGADPAEVSIDVEGVESLRVLPSGELELLTELGPVSFSAPVAYQEVDGKRRAVEVAYDVQAGGYGFSVGSYDRSLPLVIDPLLASTYIGGRQEDSVEAIAGNISGGLWEAGGTVYVTGYTASWDFPTNTAAGQSYHGGYDVFVTRFNRNLRSIEASAFVGGSSDDVAKGIVIDSSDNVYITGYTDSENYPAYMSCYDYTYNGNTDVFVTKLNSSLGLLGSTFLGGGNMDKAMDMDLRASNGDIFIVGYTESSSFPTTANAYDRTYNGMGDVFLCAFDSSLINLKSSTFMGGSDRDRGYGMCLDTTNVYFTGLTDSIDYPSPGGPYQSAPNYTNDAFVSILELSLTNLWASSYLGGKLVDVGQGIALATNGEVCVGGYTYSTDFPVDGVHGSTSGGSCDGFVTRLSGDLTLLKQSIYLGGAGDDAVQNVLFTTVEDCGGTESFVDVAGYTASADFPVSQAAFMDTIGGNQDGFVTRFYSINMAVTNLAASTYVGGFGDDSVNCMYIYSSPCGWGFQSTRVWVGGYTMSSDFPVTDAAYDTSYNKQGDGFVTRFAGSLSYGSVKWRGNVEGDVGIPAVDEEGNIYFGTSYGYVYSMDKYGRTNWFWSVGDTNRSFELSAVTLSTNGLLYVGDTGTATSKLYALNYRTPGGPVSPEWVYGVTNLAVAEGGICASPALASDGTVYFTSRLSAPKLYAVNGFTGAKVWTNVFPGISGGTMCSPVVGSDGTIYVALDTAVSGTNHNLFAYNPNGSQKWGALFYGGIEGGSIALGTNGNLYFGSLSPRTNMYCFSSNGVEQWAKEDALAQSFGTTPAIGTNGYVYYGSDDAFVYGYQYHLPFGSRTWQTLGPVQSAFSVGMEGTIYAGVNGTNGGRVFALNPAGSDNYVWDCRVDAWDTTNAVSSPVLDSEGTVYIGCGPCIVAVFNAEPLGDTPWATFQHDVMHSGNVNFRPVPAPPSGVTASDGTIGGNPVFDRIRVMWNQVTNAALYEVYRNTVNTTNSASKIASTASTGYDDLDIDEGRKYWYWVKSKHSLGTSAFSSPDSGGVPPSAPTNIVASDGDFDARIDVAWSGVQYASMYEVWRSEEDATNTAARISTGFPTNYTDNDVISGVLYYYWIKSVNEFGASRFSVSEVGGTPPSIPTGLSATDGTYVDKVRVSWNTTPGVTIYEVFQSRTASTGAAFKAATVTNVLYYDDVTTNVAPFVTNYYWVKSTNSFGISGLSDMDSGWRNLTTPGNVSATDGTYPNKIVISWDAVSDANSYQVFRSETDNTNAATMLAYTFETNYIDTTVTPGYLYYYWVKSVCNLGVSTFSDSDLGGTPPLRPTDVTATDGAHLDKIGVTWVGSQGASGYTVLRNTTSSSSTASELTKTTATNYDDTSADIGRLYYYWIKATNTMGTSAISADDSGFRAIDSPAGVSATDGAYTNKILVTWNSVEGATEYEVWQGMTNNVNSAARLDYVTSCEYTDTEIADSIVYYYWIKARNSTYSSEFSEYDSGYKALGLADLNLSELVFLPPVVGTGAVPEVVSMKVVNYGKLDMSIPNAAVKISLYLSSNAYLEADSDYLIGSISNDLALRTGASTNMVLPATTRQVFDIPGVTPGEYYVLGYINHTWPSSLYDPDLDDNVAVRDGTITVMQSVTNVLSYNAVNDYDGDGRADLAVYETSSGRWYIRSTTGTTILWGEIFGGPGFLPLVGDFDGDKKADLVVYHRTLGTWYARTVAGNLIMWGESWGGDGFTPVWGDYNDDGVSDMAVYHEATGNWYVRSVDSSVLAWGQNWGGQGFSPVWGDYDGDGAVDLAVYYPFQWQWFIRTLSGDTILWADSWGGQTGFIPVPGDYDGDGLFDEAVYHQQTGYWFIKTVAGQVVAWGDYWGGEGFTPVPGDYDGDGIYDLAVYSNATGAWYVKKVNGATIVWGDIWGSSSMTPVAE